MERTKIKEEACVAIYLQENNSSGHDPVIKDSFEGIHLQETHSNKESLNNSPGKLLKDKEGIFLEKLGIFFYKVAGQDELINTFELQNVLTMMFKEKGEDFSLETTRSILASGDSNRDGLLNYYEFKKLWFNIMEWKNCFEETDLNKDRMIDKTELKCVLKKLRISVKNSTFTAIFSRFSNKQNLISLDDFIQILCKLSSMSRWTKEFHEKMTLDAFMKALLYC